MVEVVGHTKQERLPLLGCRYVVPVAAGSPVGSVITAAVVGAVMVGLGDGLDAAIVYSQADQRRSSMDCNIYDPTHYLMMGLTLGLLGSTLFALGIIHYGIVALTNRVLSHYNWPLLVGAMALLNVALSITAMLVTTGTDYAGTQKVAILLASVALASATVWVFQGQLCGHVSTRRPWRRSSQPSRSSRDEMFLSGSHIVPASDCRNRQRPLGHPHRREVPSHGEGTS